MKISNLNFNDAAVSELEHNVEFGCDWPVVYVINNNTEAYVGETLDAAQRTTQHLQNEERKKLTDLHVIGDETFNKSAILDLESFLIKYMSADKRFTLQNGNGGLKNSNYYDRDRYLAMFPLIWDELKENGLVNSALKDIENSDLFKYSPYKTLTRDQKNAILQILGLLDPDIRDDETTILVQGGAGTGKTVLAVFLMKLLTEDRRAVPDVDAAEQSELDNCAERIGRLNCALVVPMQSLRQTIKKVFRSIHGLSEDMVLSPSEVPSKGIIYDLLLVDEAHRLRQRKALAQYPVFDKNNTLLDLPKDATELDWIFKCSKTQILFYDPLQSVKPSDIDHDLFQEKIKARPHTNCLLSSQLRCSGGSRYVNYINQILRCEYTGPKLHFDGFELRLYRHIRSMRDAIIEKDAAYGLCRVVAGYAWDWASKKDPAAYDIYIEDEQYRWNSTDKDWINSADSVNEIGCIHTVQGYDLNYVGVIFGKEISYDPVSNTMLIDKANYRDHIGKTALSSPEALKAYIINIYLTLMLRGLKGVYVYACDQNLRDYLEKYFDTIG